MKIMLINNLYPPDGFGGGERVVEEQADRFVREGNDVVVVAGSYKNKIEHYKNLKIIRFRPKNIFFYSDAHRKNIFLRFIWTIIDTFNIFSYRQLKKILIRERPDRVICHNLKGIGYFTPRLLYSLKISYHQYLHDIQLVIPSGIYEIEKQSWVSDGFFQRVYSYFTRTSFGSPFEVVSPSQWLMNYYTERGFFPRSKKVILPFLWENYDMSEIQKKLHFVKDTLQNEKKISLLYVGKIERQKGIFWLLTELMKMQTPYHLTIAGDGSGVKQMLSIIESTNNITYRGRLDRENLNMLYTEADILIMPTRTLENRPQVIVEAYQNNLPVLASNIGGIPEFVRVGESGYLFDPTQQFDLKKIFNL